MAEHSFEQVNLGNLKFRLPEKANAHGGYAANVYDEDRNHVMFASPVVKLPFPEKYGSLTVFEDFDADDMTDDDNPELPTKFSKFIQTIHDVCYASFDQMRMDKANKGQVWGKENDSAYPLVVRKNNYSEEHQKTFTSMKYNFKIFKNRETGEYDTFLCHDSFNQSTKLQPHPGLKGRLFLHLHSWYYDSSRCKFNARIYIKGITLEPTHDSGTDIRDWMKAPPAAF